MSEINEASVIAALGNMNVMQIIALTRQLEEKWGVEAVPQVQESSDYVCPGCGSKVGNQAHACPGNSNLQTEFNITLVSYPPEKKIALIKLVRELLGMGLVDSKTLVESVPKLIKEGVSKEEAETLKAKLTEAGAVITLQ